MARIDELAGTLQRLAEPGIKRKELIAAVREHHPKASKKDIVRAAFYALTMAVEGDVERAKRLHEFALNERAAVDSDTLLPVTHLKKDQHKDARKSQGQAH